MNIFVDTNVELLGMWFAETTAEMNLPSEHSR